MKLLQTRYEGKEKREKRELPSSENTFFHRNMLGSMLMFYIFKIQNKSATVKICGKKPKAETNELSCASILY